MVERKRKKKLVFIFIIGDLVFYIEKNDLYNSGVMLIVSLWKWSYWRRIGETQDIVYWVMANFCDRESVLNILDDRVASSKCVEDVLKDCY